MLTLVKNRIKSHKVSYRAILIGGFGIMVLLGFGLPYFGFGASTTASATDTLTSSASSSQSFAATGATKYVYTQLTMQQAYPYYIAASFMVAGGLSVYALSYVPSRSARRSRYASRLETWARTTY